MIREREQGNSQGEVRLSGLIMDYFKLPRENILIRSTIKLILLFSLNFNNSKEGHVLTPKRTVMTLEEV